MKLNCVRFTKLSLLAVVFLLNCNLQAGPIAERIVKVYPQGIAGFMQKHPGSWDAGVWGHIMYPLSAQLKLGKPVDEADKTALKNFYENEILPFATDYFRTERAIAIGNRMTDPRLGILTPEEAETYKARIKNELIPQREKLRVPKGTSDVPTKVKQVQTELAGKDIAQMNTLRSYFGNFHRTGEQFDQGPKDFVKKMLDEYMAKLDQLGYWGMISFRNLVHSMLWTGIRPINPYQEYLKQYRDPVNQKIKVLMDEGGTPDSAVVNEFKNRFNIGKNAYQKIFSVHKYMLELWHAKYFATIPTRKEVTNFVLNTVVPSATTFYEIMFVKGVVLRLHYWGFLVPQRWPEIQKIANQTLHNKALEVLNQGGVDSAVVSKFEKAFNSSNDVWLKVTRVNGVMWQMRQQLGNYSANKATREAVTNFILNTVASVAKDFDSMRFVGYVVHRLHHWGFSLPGRWPELKKMGEDLIAQAEKILNTGGVDAAIMTEFQNQFNAGKTSQEKINKVRHYMQTLRNKGYNANGATRDAIVDFYLNTVYPVAQTYNEVRHLWHHLQHIHHLRYCRPTRWKELWNFVKQTVEPRMNELRVPMGTTDVKAVLPPILDAQPSLERKLAHLNKFINEKLFTTGELLPDDQRDYLVNTTKSLIEKVDMNNFREVAHAHGPLGTLIGVLTIPGSESIKNSLIPLRNKYHSRTVQMINEDKPRIEQMKNLLNQPPEQIIAQLPAIISVPTITWYSNKHATACIKKVVEAFKAGNVGEVTKTKKFLDEVRQSPLYSYNPNAWMGWVQHYDKLLKQFAEKAPASVSASVLVTQSAPTPSPAQKPASVVAPVAVSVSEPVSVPAPVAQPAPALSPAQKPASVVASVAVSAPTPVAQLAPAQEDVSPSRTAGIRTGARSEPPSSRTRAVVSVQAPAEEDVSPSRTAGTRTGARSEPPSSRTETVVPEQALVQEAVVTTSSRSRSSRRK